MERAQRRVHVGDLGLAAAVGPLDVLLREHHEAADLLEHVAPVLAVGVPLRAPGERVERFKVALVPHDRRHRLECLAVGADGGVHVSVVRVAVDDVRAQKSPRHIVRESEVEVLERVRKVVAQAGVALLAAEQAAT